MILIPITILRLKQFLGIGILLTLCGCYFLSLFTGYNVCDVLKFIHLLLTLSLLGSTFLCLFLVSFKKNTFIFSEQNKNLNRIILWLLVFAVLTGTLLIYPKHFTFHTPWIQAAYVLVFLCGALVSLLMSLNKKRKWPWLWSISYLLLALMLIGIVHDAVTKTTFLF